MKAVDPVCGMTVEAGPAVPQYRYRDSTFYFCADHCREKFVAAPEAYTSGQAAPSEHRAPAATHSASSHASMAMTRGTRVDAPVATAGKDLAKDPICGMMVNKATALRTERGGRTYYFCSPQCQRTFADP